MTPELFLQHLPSQGLCRIRHNGDGCPSWYLPSRCHHSGGQAHLSPAREEAQRFAKQGRRGRPGKARSSGSEGFLQRERSAGGSSLAVEIRAEKRRGWRIRPLACSGSTGSRMKRLRIGGLSARGLRSEAAADGLSAPRLQKLGRRCHNVLKATSDS